MTGNKWGDDISNHWFGLKLNGGIFPYGRVQWGQIIWGQASSPGKMSVGPVVSVIWFELVRWSLVCLSGWLVIGRFLVLIRIADEEEVKFEDGSWRKKGKQAGVKDWRKEEKRDLFFKVPAVDTCKKKRLKMYKREKCLMNNEGEKYC